MTRTSASAAALVLTLCALTAAHLCLAVSSADCTSVAPYFPYATTTTDCIMTNMCYTRTQCCPAANTANLALCLDITTFKCDLDTVCASHVGDASWYPFTLDNGLSLSCCTDGFITTPAPSVPNLDGTSSDDEGSSTDGPVPLRTCEDNANDGCAATNMLPSLMRGFCKDAIPDTYSDAYLVQSAGSLCCEYAAAPSGTNAYDALVGTGKCGTGLLELPRVGEFHCSLVGRAATICCNGRITDTATAASSGSATSSSNNNNNGNASTLGNTYTYISNTCLYVPQGGDAALFQGVSSAVVVVIAAVLISMLAL